MTHTLERLAAEQESLLLDRFTYDTAWALGSLIRDRAKAQGAPVGISVTHGDALVFLALMPGATRDNLDWMARKRAVALRFHRSSLAMRLEAEAGGYDLNSKVEGERTAGKHGGPTWRVWRKTHIRIDAKTPKIRAAEFATGRAMRPDCQSCSTRSHPNRRTSASPQVGPLSPESTIAIAESGAAAIIPPRDNAKP